MSSKPEHSTNKVGNSYRAFEVTWSLMTFSGVMLVNCSTRSRVAFINILGRTISQADSLWICGLSKENKWSCDNINILRM